MKKKIMEQVYLMDGVGGVSIAFKRMLDSGMFDQYEMEILQLNKVTKGVSLKVIADYVKAIKKFQPDLLHIRGANIDGLWPTIAAKIAGVKHIVTGIEGMYSDMYEISPLKKWIARWIVEPLFFMLSTDIFTVYEGCLRRPKVARFKKKLRGFVYNTMPEWDITNRENTRKTIRDEYHIDGNSKLALVLSRVSYDKGFSYFCDAMELMADNWPENLDILLVGDGPYLQEVKERVGRLKIKDHIHIAGMQNNVQRFYFASDFYVTATLHENHSLSLLEACAAHIPSIATMVGGNPETISDGRSGWLIPIQDSMALANALRDAAGKDISDIERMGAAAYEDGRHKFLPADVYQKMSDMYNSILDS